MSDLRLATPSLHHKDQFEEMMDEWEHFGGRIHPGALRRYSGNQKVPYEKWLKWSTDDKDEKTCPEGYAPQHLFFLMNQSGRLLGAVSIRSKLNEGLIKSGGHIGYGIKPSERKKGYATKLLSLTIPKAREICIENILITCDKSNIGSAKTIINNGGILENEIVEEDGNIVQRYLIK